MTGREGSCAHVCLVSIELKMISLVPLLSVWSPSTLLGALSTVHLDRRTIHLVRRTAPGALCCIVLVGLRPPLLGAVHPARNHGRCRAASQPHAVALQGTFLAITSVPVTPNRCPAAPCRRLPPAVTQLHPAASTAPL